MGGSWERMVRSVKNALTSMPQDDKLGDEGLQTLIVEAAANVSTTGLSGTRGSNAESLPPWKFNWGEATCGEARRFRGSTSTFSEPNSTEY